MKALLRLGHTCYFLPDDKGIAVIIKALSRAVEVRDMRYVDEGIKEVSPVALSVEMLPQDTKILRANGDDGTNPKRLAR